VVTRIAWPDLPSAIRAAIEDHSGPFERAEQVRTGDNCLLGMVLHAAKGSFFLKGVTTDKPRSVWTQDNEALINPHVAHLTAPLVFRVRVSDWDVLGFAYLDNHRHADFEPESPDLPAIATALQQLAAVHPPGRPLRRMSQRWAQYAMDDGWRLDGNTVAHTDLHRYNILIGIDARFVDWSWPTLAAPWIDTACVALKLIQAGHTPQVAEQWCQKMPAYTDADPKAVSVFVAAARALWWDISASSPDPWKREVAEAADRWARHRGL